MEKRIIQPKEFMRIIRDHHLWEASGHALGSPADFSNTVIENIETSLNQAPIDVSGVSFKDAEISNCRFCNFHFTDCDFSGALLKDVSFRESQRDHFEEEDPLTYNVWEPTLSHCKVIGTEFDMVAITRGVIEDCDFSDSIIRNALYLRECELSDCTAKNLDAVDFFLDETTVRRTDFKDSAFLRLHCISSSIESSDLRETTLANPEFLGYNEITRCDGRSMRVYNGALRWETKTGEPIPSKLVLFDDNFRQATFEHCKFAGIEFNGTNMDKAIFIETSFNNSILSHSSLASHFTNCTFEDAVFDMTEKPEMFLQMKQPLSDGSSLRFAFYPHAREITCEPLFGNKHMPLETVESRLKKNELPSYPAGTSKRLLASIHHLQNHYRDYAKKLRPPSK